MSGDKIKKLVADGNIEIAIEQLRQLVKNTDKENEIIGIQSRLATLNKNLDKGTISPKDNEVERNRITKSI